MRSCDSEDNQFLSSVAEPIGFAGLEADLESSAGIARLDANHWIPEDRSAQHVETLSGYLG